MAVEKIFLHSFLNSLDEDDRAWLLRQLLGKSRSAHISRKYARSALMEAEILLFKRIGAAKTPQSMLPRARLWLIFMLLRYGALRPREISALSTKDLSLRDGLVRIGGESGREVWLPLEASRRMQHIIWRLPEKPDLLHCDAGLVRRSLRQCAQMCGIPADALSPSALRKNRALELELSGLPYSLINLFLGRKSRNSALASGFENPGLILKTHIQEEQIMKTSARNVFQGKISKLRQKGILAEAGIKTSSGLEVISIITETSYKSLALSEGKVVNALVKAPFVSVIPADERAVAAGCAENCFKGVVEEIHADEMAEEIIVALPEGNVICALYAHGAKPSREVAKGKEVLVCFSAFSVILTED